MSARPRPPRPGPPVPARPPGSPDPTGLASGLEGRSARRGSWRPPPSPPGSGPRVAPLARVVAGGAGPPPRGRDRSPAAPWAGGAAPPGRTGALDVRGEAAPDAPGRTARARRGGRPRGLGRGLRHLPVFLPSAPAHFPRFRFPRAPARPGEPRSGRRKPVTAHFPRAFSAAGLCPSRGPARSVCLRPCLCASSAAPRALPSFPRGASSGRVLGGKHAAGQPASAASSDSLRFANTKGMRRGSRAGRMAGGAGPGRDHRSSLSGNRQARSRAISRIGAATPVGTR